MDHYIPRLVDAQLTELLAAAGAVAIEGPRAAGKTETGRHVASSEVRLDVDRDAQVLAELDPNLVLEGATPRLVDEWQVVPSIWNAVRRAVDDRRAVGQFILTGSASPSESLTRHVGAGRITTCRMYPLTLVETGHADGSVSLASILDGASPRATATLDLSALVGRLVTGGWPGSQGLAPSAAARFAASYLRQIEKLDIPGLDRPKHDPRRLRSLLRSLARTTASEASLKTLGADAGGAETPLDPKTVNAYVETLRRAFIVEEQPAWDGALRSRTPLRSAPKRQLADSSLTAAALGVTDPARLLRDPETLGILFEGLVVQQLRGIGSTLDAEVSHVRTKSGLEVDAILERGDGAWGAFEVKLSTARIDEAAVTLRAFADALDPPVAANLNVLGVIVPSGPSYRRADGVVVIALTSLGR